jgi:hypothetical protein
MQRRALGRRRLAFIAILVLFACGCRDPWIRVQNVGTSPAQISVTYYDSNGNAVSTDSRQVGPGASTVFSVSGNDALSKGYRGSAVIESDQPVVAIRRTDTTGNNRDMIDGETLTANGGGGTLYLPLVMNASGVFNSWTSRINIQNLSSSNTACITLTYISAASGSEVAWDPAKPSRATPTASTCPSGTLTLAPNATVVREAGTLRPPGGFTGSVRIDATSTGSASPVVSATVDTANPAFNLLTSYHALTDDDLGTNVLLPLIERDAGPDGSYRTLFEMQGKTSTTKVTAQLRFEGTDAGGNYIAKSNTVSFTGSQLCDQVASDEGNCLAAGDVLPPGFSGSVTISASSPIAVVAQRGSYLADFGTYRGIASNDGGARVALPAIKRNSWLRVMPADGGAANIRIRYFSSQLPGGEADSAPIGVQGLATIFQANDPAIPNDFDGSAIIESDRPVVVVAAFDAGGGGDAVMLYDGVTIP